MNTHCHKFHVQRLIFRFVKLHAPLEKSQSQGVQKILWGARAPLQPYTLILTVPRASRTNFWEKFYINFGKFIPRF